jgi:hypothetical protein
MRCRSMESTFGRRSCSRQSSARWMEGRQDTDLLAVEHLIRDATKPRSVVRGAGMFTRGKGSGFGGEGGLGLFGDLLEGVRAGDREVSQGFTVELHFGE